MAAFESVSGFLAARTIQTNDESDDDSENDDDDDEMLDMSDIKGVAGGASVLESSQIREQKRDLCQLIEEEIDGQKTWQATGRKIHVKASFPLTQPWWQMKINLVRKRNDLGIQGYPAYRLRDDEDCDESVLSLFLWDIIGRRKIGDDPSLDPIHFLEFVRKKNDDWAKMLTVQQLPELMSEINAYVAKENARLAELNESQKDLNGTLCVSNRSLGMDEFVPRIVTSLPSFLEESVMAKLVQVAAEMPFLFWMFSQILPRHINKLGLLGKRKLTHMLEAMENEPWVFGFRDILKNRYEICGFEASLRNLSTSELWEGIPVEKKEALLLYTGLKRGCNSNGHTWYPKKSLPRLVPKVIQEARTNWPTPGREGLQHFPKAYAYLIENNVFVEEEHQQVMLYSLWKAETGIASHLTKLHLEQFSNPLILSVNKSSEDYKMLEDDPDQVKAVEMIQKKSLTVLSGKGGCGKTHVVSTLFRPCNQQTSSAGDKSLPESGLDELDKISAGGVHEESELNAGNELGVDSTTQEGASVYGGSLANTAGCSETIGDGLPHDRPSVCPGSPSRQIDAPALPKLQLTPLRKGLDGLQIQTTESKGFPATLTNTPDNNKIRLTPLKRDFESLRMDSPPKNGKELLHGASPPKRPHVVRKLLNFKGGNDTPRTNKKKLSEKKYYGRVALIDEREKGHILLTAPTGKAANLLGRRTHMPACTLHQVVFSYYFWQQDCRKMQKAKEDEAKANSGIMEDRETPEGMEKDAGHDDNQELPEWGYRNVDILVVDECSLVAVTIFETLLSILLEHANLRKVVLLGDVLQLPSVQPGNFLADVFQAMQIHDGCVVLTKNHRTEAQLLVDNATLISSQQMPKFDPMKNFHLIKVDGSGHGPVAVQVGERSYVNLNQAVQSVLASQKVLQDHKRSQFVAFRNVDVAAINEICSKYYSDHSMHEKCKGRLKMVFQVGDKVCCTKNGRVKVLDLVKQTQLDEKAQWRKEEKAHTEGECMAQELATDLVADHPNSYSQHSAQQDDLENGTPKNSSAEGMLRLCNGEIFYIEEDVEITEGGKRAQRFLTLFDSDLERYIKVEFNMLKRYCKLKHAWARTIHTFQGSEVSTVVYVLGEKQSFAQNWQHVYTAVTRGKHGVYVITDLAVLQGTIKNQPGYRRTTLKERLTESLSKNPPTVLDMQENAPERSTHVNSHFGDGIVDNLSDDDETFVSTCDRVMESAKKDHSKNQSSPRTPSMGIIDPDIISDEEFDFSKPSSSSKKISMERKTRRPVQKQLSSQFKLDSSYEQAQSIDGSGRNHTSVQDHKKASSEGGCRINHNSNHGTENSDWNSDDEADLVNATQLTETHYLP